MVKTGIQKQIESLKSEYSFERKEAAEALGKIGDEAAVPYLIEALKDKDSEVRKAARDALKKLKGKE